MAAFVITALMTGIAAGIAAGTIAAFAQAFFVALVLGALSKALEKKPRTPNFAAEGRMISTRQAISPWQAVFGEARVGGVLTFRWVSSDRSQWHMVLTLACHRSKAIDAIYFNDEEVPLASDGSGNATGKWAGFVRVQKSLGNEDQFTQPFPNLVTDTGGVWSNDHKQFGHTKIYVKLTANPTLFPAGVPNVTVLMRGALAYDDRTAVTDFTNNAGVLMGHYFTHPDYGLNAVFADEIHSADFAACANSCDEAVALAVASSTFTADPTGTAALTLPAGSKIPLTGDGIRVSTTGTLPAPLVAGTTYYCARFTARTFRLATSLANAMTGATFNITTAGTGTHTLTYFDEPRYRANGAFLTSEKPVDVIQRLAAAMAGSAVDLGDRWRFNAGVYFSPTVTLDERDLVGAGVVQAHVPSREDANAVKGVFVNAQAGWQADDFPPIVSGTYLAEDGGERRWKDIDLTAFVASATQAQRLAKIELLRGRQALTESQSFRLRAWQCVPGRTAARTDAQLGWNAKPFEIQSGELAVVEDDEGHPTLAMKFMLRETAAAIYDWSTSEEQAVDIAPNTSLPDPGTVNPPGQPNVTEALYETRTGRGTAVKAIVSWAASDYPFGALYRVEYAVAGSGVWTVLPVTRATTIEIPDITPQRYDFRVLAIGVTGAQSAYSTRLDQEIAGLGTQPSAPTGASLATIGGFAFITLSQHPNHDVVFGGRILVRHTEAVASQSWESSLSIGEQDSWPGSSVLIVLPLKPGSYLLKAQNAIGQESPTFITLLTKQASIHAFTTVDTLQEDATFPGTHSDTVLDGAVLRLATDINGDVLPDGVYTFADSFNFGAVSKVRVTGKIEAAVVNILDLIDDRLTNIDTWSDFDGSAGAGSLGDAWIEVRETDDNPAGTPTWSAWKRLDSGEYECWGMQCRAQLRSLDPAYNIEISVLRTKAEARV